MNKQLFKPKINRMNRINNQIFNKMSKQNINLVFNSNMLLVRINSNKIQLKKHLTISKNYEFHKLNHKIKNKLSKR